MWIRDILGRIRIRGSVPLTNDPNPDPAIFVLGPQDANTKVANYFLLEFFLFITFKGTFTSFFQDNKP
jgi:hypothetical protein